MKFYYQNKLIRTSKNHNYTHAVIDAQTGRCLGCRTTMDACKSIITEKINHCHQGIHNCNEIIKALEAGKSGYYSKDGRRTWWCKFDNPNHYTIENAHEWIEDYKNEIDRIQQNLKIVELECR